MQEKLTRRDVLRYAGIAGSVGLLAACQPQVVEKTVVVTQEKVVEKIVTAVPEERKQVDLRIHVRQGAHVGNCFIERKPYLEERYPYIKLEIEEIPGGRKAYWPKLKTMTAAKTIGDLINGPPSHFDYYGLCFKGALVELDPIVEAKSFDMGQYYPGAAEDCRLDTKLYGIPYDVNSGHSLLGYNPNLFDKAGLGYPTEDWTIQDFTDMAIKISEVELDHGKAWGFNHATGLSYIQILMRMFGGDLYAPDGKTCTLTSDEGLACAKWMWDLRYTFKCTPTPEEQEMNWVQSYREIATQGMAFQHYMILTTWVSAIGDNFEQGITLMPKTPDGHIPSEYRSDAVSITTNTKHLDEAWDATTYYTSYEYGVMKVLGRCASPGARPDCWEDRRIVDTVKGHDKAKKAMDQSQPFYKIYNFRGQEFETALTQSFAPLFESKMTPEEWVEKTSDTLQKVLDKPR